MSETDPQVPEAIRKAEKAAVNRAYRLANAEKIRLQRQTKYQANREEIRRKANEKYATDAEHRAKVLAQNQAYQDDHPEVARKAKQAYKERNREHERARERAYQARRRAEHPEEMRVYQNTRNAANRERVNEIARQSRARHRDDRNEKQRRFRAKNPDYDREWRKAHPESSRLKQERRRARKLGLPDTLTTADRRFMLEYWSYACAVCGNQEGFFWTLADDHWIPIDSPNCPGTVPDNIVPLCHGKNGCNNLKSNKEPVSWLISRVGATKAKRILIAIATYFAIVRPRKAQSAAD